MEAVLKRKINKYKNLSLEFSYKLKINEILLGIVLYGCYEGVIKNVMTSVNRIVIRVV